MSTSINRAIGRTLTALKRSPDGAKPALRRALAALRQAAALDDAGPAYTVPRAAALAIARLHLWRAERAALREA